LGLAIEGVKIVFKAPANSPASVFERLFEIRDPDNYKRLALYIYKRIMQYLYKLLGPGVPSIDALLFGRKRLNIGER
jgi:hypothetical protein